MKNYKLTIEYDGSNFFGWQKQKENNHKTVQGLLERALSKFYNHKIEIIGSGRTDTGVHAKGQVANFLVEQHREAWKIVQACNCMLPSEIVVTEVCEVPLDFHARYSAKLKTYQYLFYTAPVRTALYYKKAWWVGEKVNWVLVEEALKFFIGEHDFVSFQNKGSDIIKTVRTISELYIEDKNKHFKCLTISGNGFLRNMVRIIVGTLIFVGQEKMDLDYIKTIFSEKKRYNAGPMAEAGGLYLKNVIY